ncbi:uncharacterized protein LOC124341372 isoform X1 [Daphnia pulicaria]|uniref:uncharacterized protein LOC124341372 isoform X1 n=1 Tax=Daphnia pulicaria TaxID=35523 RepID=UPI001EE9B2A2|nr:uncharacterized protein LOC124341372 isoform X1 [Daphnia pulicaria]XP_046650414.1 uncharacterized protein LOC124341372 isoform X1 [Daphnia pulicaria]XP_046650415.1 uncharacterized protein LOC124341372 isoform X1 [Daphnia pulicaria]
MSHNVTVTRTTTTVTTTSAILLNTGYLKTTSGILKLLQLILGCVIVGLVGHYFARSSPLFFTAELFLLLIATTCLITTTCLLISCLLSISTATIIAKTMFVSMLLIPESVLYLCATIYHLTIIVSRNAGYSVAEYGYNNKIFAGALGAINTGLYFFSALLAFRIYRRV